MKRYIIETKKGDKIKVLADAFEIDEIDNVIFKIDNGFLNGYSNVALFKCCDIKNITYSIEKTYNKKVVEEE